MQDIASSKLSDITVFNKYAKFLPEVSRRENYNEIADRNKEMHQLKYPQLAERIENIYRDFVHTKKILPSMRSMQFGGRPILLAENRIYNCAYAPVELTKFFSELMFLLLGGTGMGYSVQRRHVNQLHKVKTPESDLEYKFQIQDSIIGWADSIKVVLKAFLKGGTLPVFDYRDIREKGADLVTTGGKAPGPEPLRKCINTIIPILRQAVGRKLTPLECHDISCIIADSVRAGGIRRAAMIALFDRDDEEMLTCKSLVDVQKWWSEEVDESADNVKVFWVDRYGIEGQAQLENFQWRELLATNKLPWYLVHPYRARANNSVVLPRGKVSEEEFRALLKVVEASRCGEPGIYWTNNEDWGTNPCCISGDTWVMTDTGPHKAAELVGKDFQVFVDGQLHPTNAGGFWETGTKSVYRVTTKRGHEVKLTADHQLKRVAYKSRKVRQFEWAELQDISVGESILLSHHVGASWGSDAQEETAKGYILGSLVGDGVFIEVPGKSPRACLDFWGNDAQEMAMSSLTYIKSVCTHRSDLSINPQVSNCGTKLRIASTGLADLAREYGIVRGHKTITEAIERTSSTFHIAFLRGLFDADGSVQGSHIKGVSVRLTQSNEALLKAAQRMLLRLGINSTLYNGRISAGYREMPDGAGGLKSYWCEEVHELVISGSNIAEFSQRIGFLQPSKQQRLNQLLAGYQRELNRDWFDDEVVAIDLIGEEQVFDVTVPGVHEFCANGIQAHNCEIGLRPYQMCNLTTINVSAIKSQEDFNLAAGAAAFLGTLQAGYTDFHYLNPKWKLACEKEALLGVSMTGIASGNIDNLNAAEAAQYAKDVNEQLAAEVGINKAARVTAVKPEGTSSLVLGTSSGIHAWHGEYYIRRMRAGKDEALAQYLMQVVPELVEEDVTDPNQVVLSFPQKAPEGAVLRHESMMELLDRVRNISENWVRAGHRSGDNYHNVSCTISVKDDEWESLTDWMWDHRDVYNGISVMPFFGSTAYPQMPFEDISKEQYEALLPLLERIDISHVKEADGSAIDLAAEAACAGGVCEIF